MTAKNIYQKLIAVRKTVPYLQKDQQGHNFNYVGSSQVLGALREKMDEQGLVLFPHIISSKVTPTAVQSQDKYGNPKVTTTYFTELEMEFEWVDAESGESKKVPFYAQGMDIGGEKGVGKALTYAEKYFLLKQFNIPTDQDDPDAFNNRIDHILPKVASDEQIAELNGYAGEISHLRGVAMEGVYSAIGVQNVNKMPADWYLPVRNNLIDMLKKARRKAEPQATQRQQQSLPVNEQGDQQVSEQKPQETQPMPVQKRQETPQPSSPQVTFESFTLKRIEHGQTPQKAAFAKLFVVPFHSNAEQIVFANTAETLEQIKELQEGSQVSLQVRQENGFSFLVAVGEAVYAS
ncbi:ERF family protein [Bacillus badius]|uniref:ERF family protein n=1 Tax=Bacillus badius TaxID=1455 RepID=UPI0005ADDAA5|nr:ERF family protein [Bacillus badius]KIL74665.1 hypothetical protein SD78_1734 [Bacillus badius]